MGKCCPGSGQKLPDWLILRLHDPRREIPPRKEGVEIVASPKAHGVARLAGRAADVRQQESVRQLSVARVDVRLIVEHVETGGSDRFERCEVADPDGNVCEFSFGQPINPRHLPRDR